MVELTLHAMKILCYRLWQQTEAHVLALVRRIIFENCKKKAGLHHTESCRQFQSCIIRLLSARDLVVSHASPWPPGFLGRMSPTRDTHHAE